MPQEYKLAYRIHIVICAWLGKGKRLGTLVDDQASQHDSTVHAQRLFPPK